MAKKVMVGIIAYDGKVVTSILEMVLEMKKYVEVDMFFVDGCSLLPAGRNEVFTEFVKYSVADYLLMLDSDNFLDRVGVHKLCRHVKQGVEHCVSARIPYRQLIPPKEGPWGHQDDEGFVDSVGAACLLVPRKVALDVSQLCRVYSAHSNRLKGPGDWFEAFRITLIENPKEGEKPVMQGEDVFFTGMIHKAGSRIALDDEMVGFHVGTQLFDFRTQGIFKKALADMESAGRPV